MHNHHQSHVVGWLSSLFVQNPFGTSAPFSSSLIFTLKWCAFHGSNNRIFQVYFCWATIRIPFSLSSYLLKITPKIRWVELFNCFLKKDNQLMNAGKIFLVLEISFGISVYKWGIYANDACHHSLLRVHFYNLFRIKRHALFMLLPSSLFNRCCSGFPYFNSFWEHGFNVIIGRYVCSTFILCLKWSKRYPGLLLPLFVTVNHKQIQLSLEQQQSHYFFFFYL